MHACVSAYSSMCVCVCVCVCVCAKREERWSSRPVVAVVRESISLNTWEKQEVIVYLHRNVKSKPAVIITTFIRQYVA